MSSLNPNSFIYVEGGRHLPNGKFTRNEMMTIHDIPSYRQQHQNTGLYISAYRYDSSDVKEANLYADFYLDFDCEEDFEKTRIDTLDAIEYMHLYFKYHIPKEMFRIYYSGKKGIHLLVPAEVFGIEGDKYLNEYFKSMAKEIALHLKYNTLDLKIYDRRRLFRLQNSRHQDTGLYKVPITYEELRTWSLEQIREKARAPVAPQYIQPYEVARAKAEFQKHIEYWKRRYEKAFDQRKRFKGKPLEFTPACVQELLEAGPIKGQRNNTAAALVSFFKRQGHTQQEIWDKLVEWNQGSLPEKELQSVLRSVFEGEYEYGCSTLAELSTCVGEKCPLHKKKI